MSGTKVRVLMEKKRGAGIKKQKRLKIMQRSNIPQLWDCGGESVSYLCEYQFKD
jgi:hypothetical protein